jgi:hypothetical protein
MADNVGAIVTRIQEWCIDSDLADAELWALMDEVIDDAMRLGNPWFCFNYAQTARTAVNHMNDSDYIPPAYEGGVLAVDADIASGTTVPDNSEYLNAFEPPIGLRKPIHVYYGTLSDNVELKYIGWEEFQERYPHNTDGGGVNDAAHWTGYGGALLVGPTPPLVATLSIYGVYRPLAISANADVNPFVEEAADLLRYGVMEKLIVYNFEEDSGRMNAIGRMLKRARNGLISEGAHRTSRAHRAKSRRAGTRRT